MEELFVNKTKYTQKVYEIFMKDHIDENSFSEKAYFLFYMVFFGTCMSIAFFEKETLLGIGILVGLIIYLWFKLIRPVMKHKKQKKGEILNGHFVNTYKFYKNRIKVSNPDGEAVIYYRSVKGIKELIAILHQYLNLLLLFLVLYFLGLKNLIFYLSNLDLFFLLIYFLLILKKIILLKIMNCLNQIFEKNLRIFEFVLYCVILLNLLVFFHEFFLLIFSFALIIILFFE